MTKAAAYRDVTDLVEDAGRPIPFLAVKPILWQALTPSANSGPASCLTFEVDAEGGPARGQLWLEGRAEDLHAECKAALVRGAIMIVWGRVMLDRHPEGARLLKGWIEFVEPSS